MDGVGVGVPGLRKSWGAEAQGGRKLLELLKRLCRPEVYVQIDNERARSPHVLQEVLDGVCAVGLEAGKIVEEIGGGLDSATRGEELQRRSVEERGEVGVGVHG